MVLSSFYFPPFYKNVEEKKKLRSESKLYDKESFFELMLNAIRGKLNVSLLICLQKLAERVLFIYSHKAWSR